MQRFARVLFHVDARHADPLRDIVDLDFQPAILGQRLIVLRNLISLGQVGIEVILAGKTRPGIDGAVQRQRRLHRHGHGFPVQHRERAWQAEAHRANIGIRRIAEMRRAGTEDLGLRQKLKMNLKADHGLIFSSHFAGNGHQMVPFLHFGNAKLPLYTLPLPPPGVRRSQVLSAGSPSAQWFPKELDVFVRPVIRLLCAFISFPELTARVTAPGE